MSVPAHLGVDAEIELIGVLEPRNDGRLGRLLLGVVGLRQQADAECARTLGQHQRIVTQTHCALTGAEQTEQEDGVTPSQHRKEKTKMSRQEPAATTRARSRLERMHGCQEM